MSHDVYGPPPSGQPVLHFPPPPSVTGAPPPPSLNASAPPPVVAPRPDRMNWLGMTSIALLCVGVFMIGAICGLLGYLSARRGEATNGKLALWGMILNIVGPAVVIGGFVVIQLLTEASA